MATKSRVNKQESWKAEKATFSEHHEKLEKLYSKLNLKKERDKGVASGRVRDSIYLAPVTELHPCFTLTFSLLNDKQVEKLIECYRGMQ